MQAENICKPMFVRVSVQLAMFLKLLRPPVGRKYIQHNKINFNDADDDDFALLADDEVDEAPADTGTYEGGHAKPDSPKDMNKWCARECERSQISRDGEPVTVKDFSRRIYNQPWKHTGC